MKFFFSLILFLSSIIFYGCDSTENSILAAENSNINFSDSSEPNNKASTPDFQITKTIDGLLGGQILIDTSFVDIEGDSVAIHTSLTFKPNSFVGVTNARLNHFSRYGIVN